MRKIIPPVRLVGQLRAVALRQLQAIKSMASGLVFPERWAGGRFDHGGVLTGHWEFDLAIGCLFLALVSYSFLLPADAPRGLGRAIILTLTILFCTAAIILAVLGFRSL